MGRGDIFGGSVCAVDRLVCACMQGGMTQMRFQPRQGRLLAAAAENVVSIFDVDSETCVHTLQVCGPWKGGADVKFAFWRVWRMVSCGVECMGEFLWLWSGVRSFCAKVLWLW